MLLQFFNGKENFSFYLVHRK